MVWLLGQVVVRPTWTPVAGPRPLSSAGGPPPPTRAQHPFTRDPARDPSSWLCTCFPTLGPRTPHFWWDGCVRATCRFVP